ncbi:benzoate 4-monooxygenase cytochrome P450 [Aspergillus bertholletiae]|uniref:Benzoate 4-monooxygenase cytochrome P450 n=1 Tax=Aspergillus bertholletiae TaxID=1226010 RepID=A0A5N7BJB4_9EURO|nr:benzoate 4-monooxygenase cytochrome P450 [Aspergillus bertholletiae]
MPIYLHGACLVSIFYVTAVVFYRLVLSPLAHFPGPRLAAATGLYEAYFQLIKGGTFTWEINRLHEQYGPIIRIKPNELHIKNPDYYSTLYAGPGKHRNKDPWFSFISFPQSIFSTEGHELHRARRCNLGQFFKKKAILQFEPVINANIERLERHFSARVGSDRPLELHTAFQCFASDTVSQYCFGTQEGFHYLDEPELSAAWKTQINWFFEFCRLNRHVPMLSSLARIFPWITCHVTTPPYKHVHQLEQDVRSRVRHAINQHRQSQGSKDGKLPMAIYPTILADPDVPESEKQSRRLEDDAIFLMMAGTDAPSQAIAITMFHILNNPRVYQKLKEELFENTTEWNTIHTLSQLEQLPYLTATIKEGLRISSIVTTRLPRIAPDEVLQYGRWKIPAGTPVSMSTYFILKDPDIFPDPTSFVPERWMASPEEVQRLEKYLVPASKGTLGCLGQNMNWAWMYLLLATLLRRYNLTLHETTEENVEMTRDNFIGQTDFGKNNIQVKVLAEC